MYRTIDAAFWSDPKIRQLPSDGRLLLLYLITNPHTHVSGIYYLPKPSIAHETGLSLKVLDTLSNTLSSLGLCRFDSAREVVWVKNMMRYQGTGDRNAMSAAHHITKDLHDTPLILDFLDAYPDVRKHVSNTVLDRVSSQMQSIPLRISDPVSRISDSVSQNTERPAAPVFFGEFHNVKLSLEEVEKLAAKFGDFESGKWIESLSQHMASKGVTYRSHYATILAWDRKRTTPGGNGNGRQKESREQAKVRRNFEAAGIPNPFEHLAPGDDPWSRSDPGTHDVIPATARRLD